MTDSTPTQSETPERETILPLTLKLAIAAQERRIEFLTTLNDMLAPDNEVSNG